MAAKQFREQIRVDMLTAELVYALIDKLTPADAEKQVKKAEIYRTAIYRMAKEELSPEEFQKILMSATDQDRM